VSSRALRIRKRRPVRSAQVRLRRVAAADSSPPSSAERAAAGKALRAKVPRRSHGVWEAPRARRDPIEILVASSADRIPELLPIRYGRMLQSPLYFFRGAAALMACDLAHTPTTGMRAQICGDCHLSNFGGFSTPERRLVFDINDFDETLPGPWEWDLKRLAASFAIAGRGNCFSKRDCRAAAAACARSYRERMAAYARMAALDAWYDSLDWLEVIDGAADRDLRAYCERTLATQRKRGTSRDLPQVVQRAAGGPAIRDDPPRFYHPDAARVASFRATYRVVLARYRESLAKDRRVLLDRYRFADLAQELVGVGSVGTFRGVALFLGADDDPLFLQVKEARPSVLEPFASASRYENRGQRVVEGQRLMQAASDLFLGWTHGAGGRHFYVRRLRDVKLKPSVELMKPRSLEAYAVLCGWALARAHARSGDAAAIAGYIGKSQTFDAALARFALTYADQNDADHAALVAAVRDGRIEARTDVS
jgi:uncharacterized protein (DUF2252 family)